VISVITATYNRASTLQRTIDSVLAQTYDDWELIVVDDGSADESAEIIARQTDPRIRVFKHEVNRGLCAAKNTGLDNIRGEWFTFLDSDDEMTPDALAAMLDCADRTGATAITCNCVDSVTGQMTGLGPTSDGWLSAQETAKCSGEHWGLTRTELLGDKRLDTRLPGCEDTLWLKINDIARRYYIHRALRIYHTEGTDRITVSQRSTDLAKKAAMFSAMGEDRLYLRLYKEANPEGYRHLIWRIRAGRILHPILRVFRT
jgi:glycosyltransferase involved in cell wall biosynthesis